MSISRLLADPYVTLMPALLAGVANMAWVKLPVAHTLNRPIDEARFGSHKTWKGVAGMVLLGALFAALCKGFGKEFLTREGESGEFALCKEGGCGFGNDGFQGGVLGEEGDVAGRPLF